MSPAVAATAIATVASDPAYFCSAYILEVKICVSHSQRLLIQLLSTFPLIIC